MAGSRMSGLVGVRMPGGSRIGFVTHEGIEALRPGDRVVIETPDGQRVATVAIASDQMIPSGTMPPIIGAVIQIQPIGPDPGAQPSREDAAYRARKAAYPPLGSLSVTARGRETVVRIDLRNAAVELRNEAGETVTVPLAELHTT